MRPSLLDGFARAIAPGRWGWWLALTIAVGSLAVIGIRPHRLVPTSPHVGVLLTEGTEARVLERVLDSLGPARIARMPTVDEFHDYPAVRDLDQFKALYPDLVSVVVLGWGLDPESLGKLPVSLIPRLAQAPEGYTVIAFQQTTSLDEPTRFLGRIEGARVGDMVYMADAVGIVDSTPLDDAGSFSLTWRPNAGGPSRLRLSVGPRIERSEMVMVDVVEPQPGRVVLLDASPSFDTSALRRWLAEGGASVVHRTRLSQEVLREERVNDPATGPSRLTRDWLRQFEMVVLDERILGTMDRRERRDLAQAITEDGLGLLIVADGAPGPIQALDARERAFFMDAEWDRFTELETRNVRPQLQDVGPSTPPLATAPVTLEDRFGQAAIIGDGTGGVLAQVAVRGAGRVGVMVSMETNRWQRHGDDNAYAGFWSALLAQIMRDPPETERWQVSGTAMPRSNTQLILEGWPGEDVDRLEITTPAGRVDTAFVTGGTWGTRPLRGLYWPRETGWHRIGTPYGGRLFYVYPEDGWQGVAATRRRDATLRAAVLAGPPGRANTIQVSQPIPPGWVFMLFLMSAAVLWLGEDFRGTVSPKATAE